jgi:hypothetical protein
VVFDEVFTGIYRLGRFNCNGFLQATPDIVVNAKLLTGGLIPLCTTTASQDIFEAFLSDSKTDALLHGHSYTAHALGCNVAVESLNITKGMEDQNKWESFVETWSSSSDAHGPWSVWSKDFVSQLSHKSSVEGVVALGTVLGITLKDETGGGEPMGEVGLKKSLNIRRIHVNRYPESSETASGDGKKRMGNTLSSSRKHHLLHDQPNGSQGNRHRSRRNHSPEASMSRHVKPHEDSYVPQWQKNGRMIRTLSAVRIRI